MSTLDRTTKDERRLELARIRKRKIRKTIATLPCGQCSAVLRTKSGRSFHQRKVHGMRGASRSVVKSQTHTDEHVAAIARLRSRVIRGNNTNSAELWMLLFGERIAAA